VASVRDHGKLRTRCDSERDEVVPDLHADGDQPVGCVGKCPFEQPVEEFSPAVEVPTQDVTVVRVHDDARPGIAREQGGHAPGAAGFRRVRVQHVRALAAEDADQLAHCLRVAGG